LITPNVIKHNAKGWSPEQISGPLVITSELIASGSHKPISHINLVQPRGEIRHELIKQSRLGKKLRRPCGQGKDRRGGLVGMTAIHERTASVKTLELFGDWRAICLRAQATPAQSEPWWSARAVLQSW